jgi:hypothetical protein
MSTSYTLQDLNDPEHRHEVIHGWHWCNKPNAHYYAARKRKLRDVPGSQYYRNSPPDEDDPWEWCSLCEMWHCHGPCF